ncbi:MAG: lipoyl(octanoyl) transferase LipB [Lamprobacter sp.]|uniref:lipoyl(octanoyl) transferase LipB n=1 Tax=Lamprobacter sp. TaxID=3100796 RepID=UPI002B25AA1F|nr:lipoyl(octanoyl) transferase LipB [Lamprobacter sp.]MEA3639025.1 lipoyl(octanoyl) transferase LipB [Lamprobacter sp.]
MAQGAPPAGPLRIRWLGPDCDYFTVWTKMRAFTDARGTDTDDELWLLEHAPVFTLGQAGLAEHLLDPGPIPVVKCDRGGQVTYHGPGQLVAYLLLDLKRARIGIKQLVHLLEQAVMDLLAEHRVVAALRPDAPGVYVAESKIASVGLRVRQGCSYHGLALNIDLDPAPFARINPCGYPGLAMTRTRDLGLSLGVEAAGQQLASHLSRLLGKARAD